MKYCLKNSLIRGNGAKIECMLKSMKHRDNKQMAAKKIKKQTTKILGLEWGETINTIPTTGSDWVHVVGFQAGLKGQVGILVTAKDRK